MITNTDYERWDDKLERLVIELGASEKAYGTLVSSDRHPRYRPYFEKRYFRQKHFARMLEDEFNIVKGKHRNDSGFVYEPNFSSLENSLVEDTMTDDEIDVLIITKEQELVLMYQRVLAYSELPGVTDAILQAQAEELNSVLYGLRLDRRIKIRVNTGQV